MLVFFLCLAGVVSTYSGKFGPALAFFCAAALVPMLRGWFSPEEK